MFKENTTLCIDLSFLLVALLGIVMLFHGYSSDSVFASNEGTKYIIIASICLSYAMNLLRDLS